LFDSVSLKIPNVCAYERDKIACTFQFVEWCFNRLGERRRAHNIANVVFFRRALHCCVVCMRSGSTSKLVSGSPFTNRRHWRRPSDRPGRSPSRLQVSTFPQGAFKSSRHEGQCDRAERQRSRGSPEAKRSVSEYRAMRKPSASGKSTTSSTRQRSGDPNSP